MYIAGAWVRAGGKGEVSLAKESSAEMAGATPRWD